MQQSMQHTHNLVPLVVRRGASRHCFINRVRNNEFVHVHAHQDDFGALPVLPERKNRLFVERKPALHALLRRY